MALVTINVWQTVADKRVSSSSIHDQLPWKLLLLAQQAVPLFVVRSTCTSTLIHPHCSSHKMALAIQQQKLLSCRSPAVSAGQRPRCTVARAAPEQQVGRGSLVGVCTSSTTLLVQELKLRRLLCCRALLQTCARHVELTSAKHLEGE